MLALNPSTANTTSVASTEVKRLMKETSTASKWQLLSRLLKLEKAITPPKPNPRAKNTWVAASRHTLGSSIISSCRRRTEGPQCYASQTPSPHFRGHTSVQAASRQTLILQLRPPPSEMESEMSRATRCHICGTKHIDQNLTSYFKHIDQNLTSYFKHIDQNLTSYFKHIDQNLTSYFKHIDQNLTSYFKHIDQNLTSYFKHIDQNLTSYFKHIDQNLTSYFKHMNQNLASFFKHIDQNLISCFKPSSRLLAQEKHEHYLTRAGFVLDQRALVPGERLLEGLGEVEQAPSDDDVVVQGDKEAKLQRQNHRPKIKADKSYNMRMQTATQSPPTDRPLPPHHAAGESDSPQVGTDVVPDPDTTPADPLPNGQLQEEQRDSDQHQQNHVGHQSGRICGIVPDWTPAMSVAEILSLDSRKVMVPDSTVSSLR
ncbi:hypothetical protein JZ751_003543 [Albula glossodonta]|uniref:Uncharacterized protein n=1 Tax=Albula glossodonta TaxID=121402 RepID=A0A8T2N7G7_9TELE|nr:hypothetical protein JZ751_003543 [Albula glossodonta]